LKQPLLKDKKWLVLLTSSILLAIIAIYLALTETSYFWIGPAIFSIWSIILVVKRAQKLKSKDNRDII